MALSVITINLNNCNGLKKTVESIEAQTYKDFEWIVVDGGSTDGSRELIEEHTKQIAKWVSEPDAGIYNAMNKGVRMATGDYLLFLNSGDSLASSHVIQRAEEEIATLLSKSEKGPEIFIGKQNVTDAQRKILRKEGFSQEELTLLFIYLYQVPHQSTFISRSLLLTNPYDESLKTASDWKFFLETIILQNVPVEILSTIIADYDSGGISSNASLHDKECEYVFQSLFPPRIVADYMKDGPRKYDIYRLGWLLRHKFAYKLCRLITSIGMKFCA